MRTVGRETGFTDEGEAEASRLEVGFERIRTAVSDHEDAIGARFKRKRVAFLEWLEPLFNGGHWIPDLVRAAGAEYTMAEPGIKRGGRRTCRRHLARILLPSSPCTRVLQVRHLEYLGRHPLEHDELFVLKRCPYDSDIGSLSKVYAKRIASSV